MKDTIINLFLADVGWWIIWSAAIVTQVMCVVKLSRHCIKNYEIGELVCYLIFFHIALGFLAAGFAKVLHDISWLISYQVICCIIFIVSFPVILFWGYGKTVQEDR